MLFGALTDFQITGLPGEVYDYYHYLHWFAFTGVFLVMYTIITIIASKPMVELVNNGT